MLRKETREVDLIAALDASEEGGCGLQKLQTRFPAVVHGRSSTGAGAQSLMPHCQVLLGKPPAQRDTHFSDRVRQFLGNRSIQTFCCREGLGRDFSDAMPPCVETGHLGLSGHRPP
ncbi:hypothetical protein [Nocardia sienata]|uniref:hypothetical protein n=1 Tax=Nocardia sienata TaxID=248552 RepID=UPI0012EDD87F|nr:hypothetical protein [Nocardia sienata]